VDYFAVGGRQNTYTVVCPQVAEFDEYRPAILEHLATVKIQHWDRAIRELAAEALGKLVVKDIPFIYQHTLPTLASSSY
jgi:hypothetical protein